MKPASHEDDRAISRSDLESLFVLAEKPPSEWRIGGEAEKFGVVLETGKPIPYEGPVSIRRIFDALVESHGWRPEAETHDGPPIALTRGSASITLEPGAQLELSGAPHEDVHRVMEEMEAHLDELRDISSSLGIAWLGVGFQPIATQEDLPWVPKERYGVMRRYLPTRGARALDMMRRTATVQANFDYSSEEDAMQKLSVLCRVSPIVHAMTANSPFIEGKVSSRKSERGDVWLHMDPSRSGLIRSMWKPRPRYRDYVEWALDAGMFLFRRGDAFIFNTGQTFRSFLESGFEGHRATFADWVLHVNTLFPEARLKRTIEMRACDSLPLGLLGSVPALLTGILYDQESLDRATELALPLDYDTVEAARPRMVAEGLAARIGEASVISFAEKLIEIADAGLRRRARAGRGGADERVHLAPLAELVAHGECPADRLGAGLARGASVDARELVGRTIIQ
jgi:glutamate--cysteine ligase